MFQSIIQNWITSVIGGIAGIPQIVLGFKTGDVMMIIQGLSIFLAFLAAKDGRKK